MLILGIILTILGFLVFQWAAKAQSQSAFERPLIFHKPIAVLIINLIWLGLFVGGFYSLWQVNSTIVLTLIGIYAVLWVIGYIMGSEKSKAKRIFKIYKQLKLFRPKAKEDELFRETVIAYFNGLRWDEHKIQMTVDVIFEKRDGKKEKQDIKDIAKSILLFESPHDDFGIGFNFEKYMKKSAKKEKAIESAYKAVMGKTQKMNERPKLSKNTLEWLKSVGLNPDEMSNEQLAVFTEMDEHDKSNWAVRFFYGTSFVFLILTVTNLIGLDFWAVGVYLVISFITWYIGHKLQMRRISKKFYEASIMKYAQEQTETNQKE